MRFHSVTSFFKSLGPDQLGAFLLPSRVYLILSLLRFEILDLGFRGSQKILCRLSDRAVSPDGEGGGVGFCEAAFTSHSLPQTIHNNAYAKPKSANNFTFSPTIKAPWYLGLATRARVTRQSPDIDVTGNIRLYDKLT